LSKVQSAPRLGTHGALGVTSSVPSLEALPSSSEESSASEDEAAASSRASVPALPLAAVAVAEEAAGVGRRPSTLSSQKSGSRESWAHGGCRESWAPLVRPCSLEMRQVSVSQPKLAPVAGCIASAESVKERTSLPGGTGTSPEGYDESPSIDGTSLPGAGMSLSATPGKAALAVAGQAAPGCTDAPLFWRPRAEELRQVVAARATEARKSQRLFGMPLAPLIDKVLAVKAGGTQTVERTRSTPALGVRGQRWTATSLGATSPARRARR